MSLSFTLNANDGVQLLDFLTAPIWEYKYCLCNEETLLPRFIVEDFIETGPRMQRGSTFAGFTQILESDSAKSGEFPFKFGIALRISKELVKSLHDLLPKKGRSKSFLTFSFVSKANHVKALDIFNANGEFVEIEASEDLTATSHVNALFTELLERMEKKNQLTYSVKTIQSILDTATSITKIVKFQTFESRQSFVSESEHVSGEFRVSSSNTDQVTGITFIEPSHLFLHSPYLKFIFENAISDSITFTFMSDFPILMDNESTTLRREYIMSPRVEEKEDSEGNPEETPSTGPHEEVTNASEDKGENKGENETGTTQSSVKNLGREILIKRHTLEPLTPEEKAYQRQHGAFGISTVFRVLTKRESRDPAKVAELRAEIESSLGTMKESQEQGESPSSIDLETANEPLETEPTHPKSKKEGEEEKLHPLPAIYEIIHQHGYMNPETSMVSMNKEYQWDEAVKSIPDETLRKILREFTFAASDGGRRLFTEEKLLPVIGVECLRKFRKELEENKNISKDVLDRGGTYRFYEINYTGIPKAIRPFITSDGFTQKGLVALKQAVSKWIADHEIERDRTSEEGKKILGILAIINDVNAIRPSESFDISAYSISRDILEISGIGPGTGKTRSFSSFSRREPANWQLGKSFIAANGKASGKLMKKMKLAEAKIRKYYEDDYKFIQKQIDEVLTAFHFSRDDLAAIVDKIKTDILPDLDLELESEVPGESIESESVVEEEKQLAMLALDDSYSDQPIRKLILDAFKFVKSRDLAKDSFCIEAVVNMHHYLAKRGVNVSLKRYWTEHAGHWTIVTPIGEFDPTISSWDDPPVDSIPGELYEVLPTNHKEWPVDNDVDLKEAYASVWIEKDDDE